MLTEAQLAKREGRLTGSRVGVLMHGDAEALLSLWREMIGDPNWRGEDLSRSWPVLRGEHTEPAILIWHERMRGPVSRRGEVVIGPKDWMAVTLDGWCVTRNCPMEAKDVGGHEEHKIILARYQPQLHWNMLITRTEQICFSVSIAAREPVTDYLPLDRDYADELMRRAEQFWSCVETLTPPCEMPPVPAPIKPEKTYSFQGDNVWGSNAAAWLETREAAKLCKEAEKTLKEMVPADAIKAHGHGVQITRNRGGALSLRKGGS